MRPGGHVRQALPCLTLHVPERTLLGLLHCCCVQVALLEPAPGNATLNWPWVSRGTPEQGIRRVEALSVPVGGASSSSKDGSSGLLERALTSILAGYGGTASSILQSAGLSPASG